MAEGKPGLGDHPSRGIHGPSGQEAKALNKLSGKDNKRPDKLVRAGMAALGSVAPTTGAIAPVEFPPTPPAIVQRDTRTPPHIEGVSFPDVHSSSPIELPSPTEPPETFEKLAAKLNEYNAGILVAEDKDELVSLASKRQKAMLELMERFSQEGREFIRSDRNIEARERLSSQLKDFLTREEADLYIEQEVTGLVGSYGQVSDQRYASFTDQQGRIFRLYTDQYPQTNEVVIGGGIRLEFKILADPDSIRPLDQTPNG